MTINAISNNEAGNSVRSKLNEVIGEINAGLGANTILNGTVVPSSLLGKNGDFYLNTINLRLYGPKTSEGWGDGVLLVGPTGDTGEQGPPGESGEGGGSEIPLIVNSPTSPPDPLPAEGTASLALQTSIPPVLWAYDGLAWSFVPLQEIPIDPTTTSFLDRLVGTYSLAEQNALNTFIVSLKNRTLAEGGSQWDSLTEIWICCLDSEVDSYQGLKGNFPLLGQNTPTFTPRRGFQLNGVDQSLSANIQANLVGTLPRGVGGAYTRFSLEPSFEAVIFTCDGGIFTYLEHYGDWGGIEYSTSFMTDYLRYLDGNPAPEMNKHLGAATVSLSENSHVFAFNQATKTTPSTEYTVYGLPSTPECRWGRYTANSTNRRSHEQYSACWVGFEDKGWTAAETQAFHADIETLLDVFGAGIFS